MPLLSILADGLLELAVPTRCAGCDLPGAVLCEKCARDLERIDPERACPRCGAPECARRCHECKGRDFPFATALSAVVFDGAAPRMVVLHKDGGERRLAAVMAGLIEEIAGDLAHDWADAVVGVPASPRAAERRGYDHGAALGAALAERLGVPPAAPLRCLTSRDQRTLGKAGRAANVGFTCSPPDTPRPGRQAPEFAELLLPARILLVDDVFTTGATTEAATSALLAAGAREVRGVAFARGLRQ